jgi:hypothetical protein
METKLWQKFLHSSGIIIMSILLLSIKPTLAVKRPVYIGIVGGYKTFCNSNGNRRPPCSGFQSATVENQNCRDSYRRDGFVSNALKPYFSASNSWYRIGVRDCRG